MTSKDFEYLRATVSSPTLFWDSSEPKQLLSTKIRDKLAAGHRELAENETMTMALNELAAQRGRGFFFHFRNRDSRKKGSQDESLYPTSRAAPSSICPEFPSIAYMDFVWDANIQAGFLESTHRSRYLKCDGQINLPSGSTPLFGIQYASNYRYPLYSTPSESLIVLATPNTLYLSTTTKLDAVIGRWPSSKKQPVGPSPEMRLNNAAYLWPSEDKNHKMNIEERRAYQIISTELEVCDVEVLYNRILAWIAAGELKPNLTVDQLKTSTPRPQHPEAGIPLGTPLQASQASHEVYGYSGPSSRRGGRLSGRGGRSRGSLPTKDPLHCSDVEMDVED